MEDSENPRQQQLLSTATSLFMKFGIRRVSVEEICKEAGVSKMTFYKFFNNKLEVVRFILDQMTEEAMAEYHAFINADLPYEEKVRRLIQLKNDYTEGISKEFLTDMLTIDDPEFQAWYQQTFNARMQLFLEHFREARDRGDIRPDVKPEFILYVINMMTEVSKDQRLQAMFDSTQELSVEMMNLLFYGILSRDK